MGVGISYISYIAKRYCKANNKYINRMMIVIQVKILRMWMQIICVVGQWVKKNLAPEKLEIGRGMLPRYCSNIADQYDIKVGGVHKLVLSLVNKSKYVLHYRNLQLYLSLGKYLIVIHKILKFKQSDWLKKYVDFNTGKRKNAANSF